MEALYLLCYITSTILTSSILSFLLAVRYLFSLLPRAAAPPESLHSAAAAVRIYEGRVHHARRRPAAHAFEYPVRYALFDLDRSPQPPPHLSADRARRICSTAGPVFLLTIPPSVGYQQNPLSVYYCYDKGDEGRSSKPRLKMCIAEVTNTPWGEGVSFVFNPGSDLIAKHLHVSPFMDMLGNWRVHATEPGEDLFISISVQHPTFGNYFSATLSAKMIDLLPDPLGLSVYFWLMPHKVAIWIYWQAIHLWWKKVAFLQHPSCANPMYRQEAVAHDRELCDSSGAAFQAGSRRADPPGSVAGGGSRWCLWRDARWPWS